MTVFHNENRFDTSNVWFEGGQIKVYDKSRRLPEMRHIDYGLSVFSSRAFADFSKGSAFDLAEVMQRLVARQQLAGFEVHERFYEIGSTSGLAELESLLAPPKRETGI